MRVLGYFKCYDSSSEEHAGRFVARLNQVLEKLVSCERASPPFLDDNAALEEEKLEPLISDFFVVVLSSTDWACLDFVHSLETLKALFMECVRTA